jgi:hypothetical protein
VRQGCPLSALLFTISVEIMALRIRHNASVPGFLVPNEDKVEEEVNISQYADDATVILGNASDTDRALDIVTRFGMVSGLILNLEKTVGIPLGQDRVKKKMLTKKIKWTDEPVKVLGIHVGDDKEKCEKLNWEGKVTQLEKTLCSWKQRDLTLIGKITVIKSLALPNITYTASMISIPTCYQVKIIQILYKFLWKTRDRIKRTYMINKVEEGGLNMTDVKSQLLALKAVWNQIRQSDNKQEQASQVLSWYDRVPYYCSFQFYN